MLCASCLVHKEVKDVPGRQILLGSRKFLIWKHYIILAELFAVIVVDFFNVFH